ncbi:helix-turn-helix domain-containing protein [Microbispora bryophytorum]|uniref:helix-turn-helix domain-containing protein n=1 Tax=Microbispora bryophytorum TaxID=1460882 RepID=UPI0033D2D17D
MGQELRFLVKGPSGRASAGRVRTWIAFIGEISFCHSFLSSLPHCEYRRSVIMARTVRVRMELCDESFAHSGPKRGNVMKSPTVRHRRLGRELRRFREQTGLSPEAAAHQLGWSRSKLNRVENARLLLSAEDIGNACDLYGVDSTGKAGLIQLGRDAGKRGWWTAYSDVFTGSYIALETEATAIRKWEPILVPGLLQNEDYAREIISAARPELTAAELDRHVDARMARKINLIGSRAPKLHALVDETVLHRPVGEPGVMARQLDDILQAAAWPNVTMQVLPMKAGAHGGVEGGFSVLSFGDEDPDVGYAEGPAGDVYVEATDQVRRLKLTFGRLAGACLSPEESAALVAAVRSEHVP